MLGLYTKLYPRIASFPLAVVGVLHSFEAFGDRNAFTDFNLNHFLNYSVEKLNIIQYATVHS